MAGLPGNTVVVWAAKNKSLPMTAAPGCFCINKRPTAVAAAAKASSSLHKQPLRPSWSFQLLERSFYKRARCRGRYRLRTYNILVLNFELCRFTKIAYNSIRKSPFAIWRHSNFKMWYLLQIKTLYVDPQHWHHLQEKFRKWTFSLIKQIGRYIYQYWFHSKKYIFFKW